MSSLDAALALAKKEFHVFPLAANTKDQPTIKDYSSNATRDPEQIKKWWLVNGRVRNLNVAISTHRYNGKEALIVVDVDNKDGKNGTAELERLKAEGKDFPHTLSQTTPNGGTHLIYRAPAPVKGGVNVLANGLDIRSFGQYIVAAGSFINGRPYTWNDAPIAEAPEWLVKQCGLKREKEAMPEATGVGIDRDRAVARGKFYLENEAGFVSQGSRNDTGFKVACILKDYGLSMRDTLDLMLQSWKCEPMLPLDELDQVVRSAYKYGLEPQGSKAPETQFPVVNPEEYDPHRKIVEQLNEEFAFVIIGRSFDILWETTNAEGKFEIKYLDRTTFEQLNISKTVMDGNRPKPVASVWMKHKNRRSYHGVCFMPGQESRPNYYNLWRGFTERLPEPNEKFSAKAEKSLALWLEHVRENVCGGNVDHFKWLIGWIAQMFQKPWQKPLTAVVLKGGKGVGKNAFIDRIGHLLGNHYLLTSNQRYLISNFNAHLEYLLFFACNEAFWSGEKQADSILKELVTGSHHVIERKNRDPYKMRNLARVVVMGNEDWIVPASHDERRYAVFNVGDKRKQDVRFFQEIQEGMESGGYRLLLKYLLEFDLTGVNINVAPSTDALLEQKEESLGSIEKWLLSCLRDDKIHGAGFLGGWGSEVGKDAFRHAYIAWMNERKAGKYLPVESSFGRAIMKCLPKIQALRKREPGVGRHWVYQLPTIEEARQQWDEYIGHETKWD